MGPNNFEKKYQKVPIKIAMGIAIAVGYLNGPRVPMTAVTGTRNGRYGYPDND